MLLLSWGFHGGSDGKEPASNEEAWVPSLGWEGLQRSLVGCSPWGHRVRHSWVMYRQCTHEGMVPRVLGNVFLAHEVQMNGKLWDRRWRISGQRRGALGGVTPLMRLLSLLGALCLQLCSENLGPDDCPVPSSCSILWELWPHSSNY